MNKVMSGLAGVLVAAGLQFPATALARDIQKECWGNRSWNGFVVVKGTFKTYKVPVAVAFKNDTGEFYYASAAHSTGKKSCVKGRNVHIDGNTARADLSNRSIKVTNSRIEYRAGAGGKGAIVDTATIADRY